jgi:tetratricopeptide (TPR) repeat protein
VARDLDADLQLLRTILEHAQKRDFARASALAERALADGFEHPLLFNVIATRLEEAGRFEDAAQLLQRAVTIAPADVGARNALAMCLQRLDRPAEALKHLDELLSRDANLAFAHANRGNALIALGALGQARTSHLRALELEPGNFAAAAALASIATHRGEHQEARQWAERALATVPGFPDAVLSLAAAELASGATARAETLLRGLLADPRAAPIDRARADGLLGDVLDAGGRYADAFGAYTRSGEALRKIHRRYATGTGALAFARALTAELRSFATRRWAVPAAPQPGDGGAAGHAFVLGFPRSGTTLLEVVLDGHPQVVSLEEHELLTESVLRYLREPPDLAALVEADEGELQTLRAAYWNRVRAGGVTVAGKVFVDKHPMNTLRLPLIARLFPEAKILFACRDPRDVVLSCFRRRFSMNPAMYELLTLAGAAEFYDAVMGFAEQARPVLGLAWHEVRYESLLADFEGRTREICAFLGLEWVAGMEDFAARMSAREHATPSTAQLVRGLDRSGVGHWRHYRAELEQVLPVLQYWVTRAGYAA